jgi:hypothetical protein
MFSGSFSEAVFWSRSNSILQSWRSMGLLWWVECVWSWCAPHVTWLWECGPVLCTISVCFAVVHNSYSEASCCSLQVKKKNLVSAAVAILLVSVGSVQLYVYVNVVSDRYFLTPIPSHPSAYLCLVPYVSTLQLYTIPTRRPHVAYRSRKNLGICSSCNSFGD